MTEDIILFSREITPKVYHYCHLMHLVKIYLSLRSYTGSTRLKWVWPVFINVLDLLDIWKKIIFDSFQSVSNVMWMTAKLFLKEKAICINRCRSIFSGGKKKRRQTISLTMLTTDLELVCTFIYFRKFSPIYFYQVIAYVFPFCQYKLTLLEFWR